MLLWQTGRAAEAAEWFDKALTIDPDFADAHYMRGLVLQERGNLPAAIDALRAAIALRPSSADAHLSLARALQQHGDHDAAAAAVATATRLSQLKADAQASTFAVGAGRERLRAQRSRRRHRAVPRGACASRPTTPRRITSWRSPCVRAARSATRSGISTKRRGSRRTSSRLRTCKPMPTQAGCLRRLTVAAACVSVAVAAREPAPHADERALAFAFSEVAAEAGIVHETVFGGVDRNRFLLETTGPGIALIDVDADGWLDIFVVNGTLLDAPTGARTPSAHMYRNRRDGRFEDVTDAMGLRQTGWGQAACVGDYDRDGRDDLYVTYWGQNRLFRNTGGRFEDVTEAAGLVTARRWGAGCAFLDIDRDGHLDLFAANYIDFDPDRTPTPDSGLCRYKGIPVACGPPGPRGRQVRAVSQHGPWHLRRHLGEVRRDADVLHVRHGRQHPRLQ